MAPATATAVTTIDLGDRRGERIVAVTVSGRAREKAAPTIYRGDGGFADRRRKAGACDGDKGGL